METKRDVWSEWLLNRRFGGEDVQKKALMEKFLRPVKDKVLKNAAIKENSTLLDVGCGDGLVSFGAFDKSETVKVIFSDISQDILDYDKKIAEKLGYTDRSRFIRASAENLSGIADESVETVTERSVLVYVENKQKAFNEFYRTLKPGGRLSIFEPINKYDYIETVDYLWGYNVEPVVDIANKIKAVYENIQPPESDPMLNFDERDLMKFAENSGFKEVHLELQVDKKPKDGTLNWDILLNTSFHPKFPTLEEAMKDALTSSERNEFVKHLLPLVEAHQGTMQSTIAYMWAVK